MHLQLSPPKKNSEVRSLSVFNGNPRSVKKLFLLIVTPIVITKISGLGVPTLQNMRSIPLRDSSQRALRAVDQSHGDDQNDHNDQDIIFSAFKPTDTVALRMAITAATELDVIYYPEKYILTVLMDDLHAMITSYSTPHLFTIKPHSMQTSDRLSHHQRILVALLTHVRYILVLEPSPKHLNALVHILSYAHCSSHYFLANEPVNVANPHSVIDYAWRTSIRFSNDDIDFLHSLTLTLAASTQNFDVFLSYLNTTIKKAYEKNLGLTVVDDPSKLVRNVLTRTYEKLYDDYSDRRDAMQDQSQAIQSLGQFMHVLLNLSPQALAFIDLSDMDLWIYTTIDAYHKILNQLPEKCTYQYVLLLLQCPNLTASTLRNIKDTLEKLAVDSNENARVNIKNHEKSAHLAMIRDFLLNELQRRLMYDNSTQSNKNTMPFKMDKRALEILRIYP